MKQLFASCGVSRALKLSKLDHRFIYLFTKKKKYLFTPALTPFPAYILAPLLLHACTALILSGSFHPAEVCASIDYGFMNTFEMELKALNLCHFIASDKYIITAENEPNQVRENEYLLMK